MEFYQKFLELCISKGKSPSRAALDNGLSKQCVSRWRNGSIPTDIVLTKLAKYFGVSVSYLMGKEQKEKLTDIVGELDSELSTAFSSLTDEEKAKLIVLLRNKEKLSALLRLL